MHFFAGKFNKRGFTMLEVVAALFVVSVGILGIFSLTIQTVSLLDVSSDRLTAAYLVQEGIEVVRNIRDSNRLKNSDWDRYISAGEDYEFDFESSRFPDNSCNLAAGNYLRYDSNGKVYSCHQGTATQFKRQITVTKPDDFTINIVVKVEWTSKNKTHQITGQENIYDWQ